MLEESHFEQSSAAESEPVEAADTPQEKGNQEGKSVTADLMGVWNRLYTGAVAVAKSRSNSSAADPAKEQQQEVEKQEEDGTTGAERKSESSGRNYWESAQTMLRTGASSIQKYSAQVATATRTAAESALQTVQQSTVYNNARSTLGELEARLHSPAENLNKLADGLAYENLQQEEGAIELSIPPTAAHSQMSVVPRNCTIQWKFCIKSNDLGFAVRRRVQEMGGAVEEDIHELKRYTAGEIVTGEWKSDGDKDNALVFVWDNKHSRIRPKTFVYKVKIYPPGTEPRIRGASSSPPPSNLVQTQTQVETVKASAETKTETLLDIPAHSEPEQKQEEDRKPAAPLLLNVDTNNDVHDDGDDEEEEVSLAEISLPRDQDDKNEDVNSDEHSNPDEHEAEAGENEVDDDEA